MNVLDKTKTYLIYCASFYGEELAVRMFSMGIDVIAFLDNSPQKHHKQLLGRTIYRYQESREKYPEASVIIANQNWGTVYEIAFELERDGYQHNNTYFIYQELDMKQQLPGTVVSWHLYLKDKCTVLIGEKYLCTLFQNNFNFAHNKCIMPDITELEKIHADYPKAFWIILTRGNSDFDKNELAYYSDLLLEKGIKNYTGYFSSFFDYCVEKKKLPLRPSKRLGIYQINQILFLKMSSFSGSIFINSIMTEHPNILYTGYSIWSFNIWTIVKKAAQADFSHIVDYIIELIIDYYIKLEQTDFEWIERYKNILKNYFTQEFYTEKEIFLFLHLAYYECINGSAPPPGNYIIYMDIHSGELICDAILSWLKNMEFEVMIIEMIRRPYMRLGSAIRYTIRDGMELPQSMISSLLPMMATEVISNVERQFPIIRLRFEDAKLYPEDILKKLCNILQIPWPDTLISKVGNSLAGNYVVSGNVVKGFNTKPVYYSYDEYFDAFDKFRLDMIFREKNKAYGYSYVEENKYPAKLTEDLVSFFEIPFQFEKHIKFQSEGERMKFRKKLAALCLHLLDMQRHKSEYPSYYNFGDYITPEIKL